MWNSVESLFEIKKHSLIDHVPADVFINSGCQLELLHPGDYSFSQRCRGVSSVIVLWSLFHSIIEGDAAGSTIKVTIALT